MEAVARKADGVLKFLNNLIPRILLLTNAKSPLTEISYLFSPKKVYFYIFHLIDIHAASQQGKHQTQNFYISNSFIKTLKHILVFSNFDARKCFSTSS